MEILACVYSREIKLKCSLYCAVLNWIELNTPNWTIVSTTALFNLLFFLRHLILACIWRRTCTNTRWYHWNVQANVDFGIEIFEFQANAGNGDKGFSDFLMKKTTMYYVWHTVFFPWDWNRSIAKHNNE